MAKRLLILSEPLTPPSYSPRLTSLIRYLSKRGWQCTLESEPLPAHRRADSIFRYREYNFTKRLLRTYHAQDFDAVFCSTFYYFPLLTARSISKKWHLPLIIDVRDIAEQWGQVSYFTQSLPHLFGLEKLLSRLYVARNIRMRNRVLNNATAVTTVSPWHRQFLQSISSAPVSLIYNGYDEYELQPENVATDYFCIAYIGRIISLRLRQPQLLFQAVSELQASMPNLQLAFYSEPELTDALRSLAEQYHIQDRLQLHLYVPRSEIQNIMAQASILVALGAPASTQQHGILGTKVFEAIGVEKPFMLIPTDEENLEQLIRQTDIGIASSDVEQIKDFITKQYTQWKQQGYTRCTITDKQRFSRAYQAKQFEQILLRYVR